MNNEKQHSQAIKPTSLGGGGRFKYVSMADIVAAGVEIPKTRVKPYFDNAGNIVAEYVEWFEKSADGKGGEWLTGSRIVDPDAKNLGTKSQQYGAALSYARRYTVYMALGLVTDDDAKMEQENAGKPDGGYTKHSMTSNKASEKQIGYLKKLAGQYYDQTIASIGGESSLTAAKCSELIDYILKKKKSHKAPATPPVATTAPDDDITETIAAEWAATPISIEDFEH